MYPTDITIFYQGGSGGFALYYYLLLTGEYQYPIDQVKSMIAQQFPAELKNNPNNWKGCEQWPDLTELKKKSGKKIFLICNPLFQPVWFTANKMFSDNTYKILLYTDLHTQLRMAYKKQAYWFTKISRTHFNAPADDKKYLRTILNSGVEFCGELVDPEVPKIVDKFNPCKILKLTNFVLDKSGNSDQTDFLKYWISLQPTKIHFHS